MKKILTIILTLSMLFGMIAIRSYAESTPTIRVGSASAAPGETIDIDVEFLNNPGINSYTLTINYDSSKLSLESVTPNGSLGGQFAFSRKAVWISSSNTTFSGTFLTLHFEVNEEAAEGDTTVTVSYNPGEICNYNEDDVNFDIVPGVVTIGEGGAAGSAEIVVGSAEAAPGETVSIPVDFINNPGINTYSLTVVYDDNKLSLDGVTSNPNIGGQFAFSRRAVWFSSADTTFSGTFLTLNFTVLQSAAVGDTAVTVSYQPGDICNYNEDDVTFAVTAGAVTIVNNILLGDVNGDGRVTSKDLQLLKKYMADAVGEDEIVYANSDINADNRITSKDVNLLKAILAS